MTKKISLVLATFIIGCGGGGSTANPCATPNSTYLEQCVEESGSCGPVTDQVINISPEGDVMTATGVAPCATVNAVGCVVRGSGCTDTQNGATATSTFQTTFAADGSSAKSIVTLAITTATDSCASTYNCLLTRQ